MRLRSRAAHIGLAATITLSGLALSATGASAQAGYQDSHASIPARVSDLLKRMTLEEKVGQMTQPAVINMQGDCQWAGGALVESCMQHILGDLKAGSVLSGGGETPPQNTPKNWADMVNTVQKYAIDHSRLHIPIVYGVDAVHGHNNVLGATKFPQQVGVGATWDPQLSEAMGESTARAVKATGPQWDFAPVEDISRDTRWGRYYETYSEDPYLAGSLGAANVQGLQKTGQVAATVKHFIGYSAPFSGHDRTEAHLDPRYIQDTFLPAYKAAVDAGALTLMANSGSVNGIPAHASHYLLTDLLRRQWGFKGVVVSDWNDVQSLQTAYHLSDTYAGAAAIAVNAGVDMAMLPPGSVDDYVSGLIADVKNHKVSKSRIDEAVSRILTLKFKLGLFEHPYVDASKADGIALGADKDLAVKAATESQTLLKNDGNALPLSTGLGKVVVTGPSADSIPNQDGGWTIGWQGIPDGVNDPGVTIYQGIKNLIGDHAKLVTDAGDAVDQTKGADAAIVVVGEKPGAEGTSDNETPELAADQQKLVDDLQATGKPVIVVVVAGRPLALGSAADAKQLLMSWLPGSEGGTAVANVLFGKANPSARLPVSWPKTAGDEPMFYQQLPGTNSGPSSSYDPLFAFGAGLSYTSYAVNDISVSGGSTVKVSVKVANTGAKDGDMVVPVFAQQPVGRIVAPPNRLVAYTRVSLKAGQSTTVSLSFSVSRLAVTQGDINGSSTRSVIPGLYKIVAGGKSADLNVH
ncbi:MAG TPA: glycoside hydrolase family 3 N-terminal domain-containing protein [Actinoallomurus sp.]|nr:glycoside hydrolase family 3 N-terminal domain-containing protein [Actinoallomurus sp.]